MEALLGTLGIDWRLFIGQVVNFLLFLVVLRVFAYKPLLAVMQKRRETIERGLQDAKRQAELVASIEEEKLKILKEARHEAERLLREARERAEREAERIAHEAEARVEDMTQRAKEEISREKGAARDELKQFAGELSISIAEKILAEHIDAKREETFIRDMLKQID